MDTHTHPPGDAPAPVPPFRVLCVDDNRDVADSEVDLLLAVGFDARACYDGARALAEAAGFRPGLCLIDLNMPGMDGDELAVLLREQAAGGAAVMVAVTAKGDEESRRRIRAAGFDVHLVKPADPHRLLGMVEAVRRAWETGGRADLATLE